MGDDAGAAVDGRGPELGTRLGNAAEDLKRLDWRLREVLLVPVDRLT